MNKNTHKESFVRYKKFHFHSFSKSGISFGIHFSQTIRRIDIHFLWFMISIGRIPIHSFGKENKLFAVSDSYHENLKNKIPMLYVEPSNDNILCKERESK